MIYPEDASYTVPADAVEMSGAEISKRYTGGQIVNGKLMVACLVHYEDAGTLHLFAFHDGSLNAIRQKYEIKGAYNGNSPDTEQVAPDRSFCALQWSWVSLAVFYTKRIEYVTPRSLDNNPLRYVTLAVDAYLKKQETVDERR